MNILTAILLLSTLASLVTAKIVTRECDITVFPVPSHYAPGETDLKLLDGIVMAAFNSQKNSFEANQTKDETMTDVQVEEQITWRPEQEGGRRMLASFWYGRLQTDFTCRLCNTDNLDKRRKLIRGGNGQGQANGKARKRLEGISDEIASAMRASEISFFSEVECVMFQCDGFGPEDIGSMCN
jgi:hypothetical protein